MEKTGAQLLLDILKLEGVEVAFGYPGGAVIPLFDALYDEYETAFNRASGSFANIQFIAGVSGAAVGLVAAGVGTYLLLTPVKAAAASLHSPDVRVSILPGPESVTLSVRLGY